jgi:hypothetical protein
VTRLIFSTVGIVLGLLGFAAIAGWIVKSPGAAAFVLIASLALLAALRRPRSAAADAKPVRLAGRRSEPSSEEGDEGGRPEIAPERPAFLRPWLPSLPSGVGLPVILGDVGGRAKWLDLATAPHVLVGGSTGSGKSVFLASAIVSATALRSPDELRLLLIDPKRVELSRFRRLPHVEGHATDNAGALRLLRAAEAEMDRRYRGLEALGARDVSATGEPRVLVVIDEYADLILSGRKTPDDAEPTLVRLLSLGRAAGVHVILATQRPDRTVVTGLIKANCGTVIAFRVPSVTNSRIILDARGAEALRGAGDGMIVCPQLSNADKPGNPVRFQGYKIPDNEIDAYIGAFSPRPSGARTSAGGI